VWVTVMPCAPRRGQVVVQEHSILLLITVLQARVCSTVDMCPVLTHLARSLDSEAPGVVTAAEKVSVVQVGCGLQVEVPRRGVRA
jgi:hypothetical protein